ncbi:hypothetical protein B296_00020461 [Ensete ventricosum]|uniref:Ubiquitin-specific protease family C19-related protein n=1 Tax=Ensete ventricosum TaxID=4639 RepID=A0A426Z323_ENSVE|nr:hypothetical protein B296_00020461 [Ensete ventricosum]
MGSRFPSHQLSNGLYVSGRPEQAKEKPPTMSSIAMPYTGGDIKRSGELGKMFDLHMEKSRKSGPLPSAPLRNGSFGGAAPHSGPVMTNASGRCSYSGSLSSAVPVPNSSVSRQKSNSGPLKHGDSIKKSSGPQFGGINPMVRQNSGPLPPPLPATGLITSGPINSGPLNSSGVPHKVSGPLKSIGSVKLHNTAVVHNQAVTNLGQEEDYSFKGSLPKPILWSVVLLFVMGFIAGGFILGAVHNAVLLIVVLIIFGAVSSLFIWNTCFGRRAIIGFISQYPDAELKTAKDGQYVKVTGVCSFLRKLLMILEVLVHPDLFLCSFIKEGSTVSVMGIVRRNDNVLMIVPPSEPFSTGCQWAKCILPANLEGIVLRCEDTSKIDVIPV